METKRRFAFTPIQKTILWAGLLLVVWRYLQVPKVVEAIIQFCAAGEIPGTDIILSPDAVLWLVFGSCVAGAAVLFVRLFVAVPRQYPAPADRPVVYRAPVRQNRGLGVRIAALWRPLAYRWSWWVARVYPTIMHARRIARHRLLAAWSMLRHGVWWLCMVVKIGMLEVWAIGAPFARRFDSWLRAILNHYGPTAKALKVGRAIVAVIQDILHKTHNASRQSHSERG